MTLFTNHRASVPSPARRRFVAAAAALLVTPVAAAGVPARPAPLAAPAAPDTAADYRRLLVLVELKGGNDGFNTLVPYADPLYRTLRPRLAIARDAIVQLSDRAGLHPALAPLLPLWQARELALIEGVSYPDPNLSHFRSIEIWNTASRSDQYMSKGWLTRTFEAFATPSRFAADGFVIGSYDLGPLEGGARALTIANPAQLEHHASLVSDHGSAHTEALAHILTVETDIVRAATRFRPERTFATAFPANPFGNVVRSACEVVGGASGVAALKLTLNGFDTHVDQLARQARLLDELAQGLVALRAGLVELGRWDDTLVLTYAEFGRRPHENASAGTDHGTANVHFALGGRVAGGLHGATPSLDRLGPDGNPVPTVDFRSVYATVLERWWNVDSRGVLGGRFATLPFVRA
jgi:uncharacterized protein (DUF1501 family)